MKFYEIKKIKSNEFLKNVLTLMTGTVISQIIGMLMSPILSRLYSPEEFGVFATYFSIVSILIVFSTLRYENAIMLPKSIKEGFNLSILVAIISSVFFVFLSVFIFLFRNDVASFLELKGKSNLIVLIHILPISILIYSFYHIITLWQNRLKLFKNIAKSRVLQSTIQASFNSLLSVFGQLGLVLGSMLGMFSFFIRNIIRKDVFNKFKELYDFEEIKKVAWEYRNYPKFDVFSGLLGAISIQLPVLIFSVFFESDKIGYYSMAQRVLCLPLTFVGASAGQVFFQKASEIKDDSMAIFVLYKKTVLNLLFLGTIPMFVIAVWGPYLFNFVFGDSWYTAGVYARWMVPWLFSMLLVSPVSSIINIKRLIKYNLFYSAFFVLFRFIGLYLGGDFGDDILSIKLFSLVSFVFNIGYLIWFFKNLKNSICNEN